MCYLRQQINSVFLLKSTAFTYVSPEENVKDHSNLTRLL